MAPIQTTVDYYKVLEIEQTATLDTINKSYRNLARQLHPDRNTAADATQAFQQLQEAHETLSDEVKRREYDQIYPSIGGPQQSTPQPAQPAPAAEPAFRYHTPRQRTFREHGFQPWSSSYWGKKGGWKEWNERTEADMRQPARSPSPTEEEPEPKPSSQEQYTGVPEQWEPPMWTPPKFPAPDWKLPPPPPPSPIPREQSTGLEDFDVDDKMILQALNLASESRNDTWKKHTERFDHLSQMAVTACDQLCIELKALHLDLTSDGYPPRESPPWRYYLSEFSRKSKELTEKRERWLGAIGEHQEKNRKRCEEEKEDNILRTSILKRMYENHQKESEQQSDA